MRKELRINTIHLGEIVHASQEHIDLDDFLERRVSFGEDRREVQDAAFGHLGDARGGEREDVARAVTGDLAAAVDCGGGGDGLGL